jgi:peroxiredoxin
MKKHPVAFSAALCVLLWIGVAFAQTSAAPAAPENNIAETLSAFGRYFDVELEAGVLPDGAAALEQSTAWPQLFAAARSAQLPWVASRLVASRVSLDELRRRQSVTLLHLRAPEEFVIAQSPGKTHTLLWEGGRDRLIENRELQKRYTGEALEWKESKNATWRIEEPVRFLKAETIGGASELVATIIIRNTGKKPLRIEVASTSCGCTGASLAPGVLPPGGKGVLTAKMHATDNRLVTVNLRADDVARPRAVVALQSQVPTGISAPPTLLLSAQKGETATASTTVQLPSGAVVTKATTRHAWLQTRFVALPKNGAPAAQQRYRVDATLKADAPAGRVQDEIRLQLKNAPVRALIVPVDGFVSNDITVQPSLVSAGEVPLGSTLRKTVIVRGPAEAPFSIRAITGSSERVSGKADPNVSATAHAVELQIVVEGKVGDWLQERATLLLSDGRALDVDILGTIAKPNATASASALQVGQSSPEFSTVDAAGVMRRLSDLKGKKNLLLTFFPKCFTGGCAGQLASLQRELPNFAQSETEVWAVSTDAADDQAAFAAKLGLQFPLLPDTDRKLSILYGAAQTADDLAARQSVFIDKSGVVRWIDTDVHVETHGADVLAKMREFGVAK